MDYMIYDNVVAKINKAALFELLKEYDAWKGPTKNFDPCTRVVDVVMGIYILQNNWFTF